MTLSDMQPGTAIAFARHDHDRCSARMLAHAEALAAARGLRLTPVRRQTLKILLQSHRAVGAYEILDKLSEAGFGKQPPVAYRALDFLVAQGLAHRIRRLNAFTACMHPGEPHRPAFFICRACDAVAEAPDRAVGAVMEAAAAGMDFVIERMNVEALGLCPACTGPDT